MLSFLLVAFLHFGRCVDLFGHMSVSLDDFFYPTFIDSIPVCGFAHMFLGDIICPWGQMGRPFWSPVASVVSWYEDSLHGRALLVVFWNTWEPKNADGKRGPWLSEIGDGVSTKTPINQWLLTEASCGHGFTATSFFHGKDLALFRCGWNRFLVPSPSWLEH